MVREVERVYIHYQTVTLVSGKHRWKFEKLPHALSPPRKFQANISFPVLLPLPLYSMLWNKKNKNTSSYILVEGISYSRNPSPHKFFFLSWYTVLLYSSGWSWALHPPPSASHVLIRTSSSSSSSLYHAHWDSRFSRNPDSNSSTFYPHNHH